jgi:hypothetical protein
MSRSLATVVLTEDDDGAVTARVDAHGGALDTQARRAVLHAVAAALELDEPVSEAEWVEAWRAEIAKRRSSIADGRASSVSASEFIAKLEATARGATR